MTTKWAGWIVAALALAALAAGAVYAASHSAEVRITARQLEDGRVEFALQQRVDGEWGERQLPRSRYFPVNAAVGRWLNSTSLTVSVAERAPTPPEIRSPANLQPPGEGWIQDGVAGWFVGSDDFTDARESSALVFGDSSSIVYKPTLVIHCEEGQLLTRFGDLPVSDINDNYTVTMRWGSMPATTHTFSEVGNAVIELDAASTIGNITRHSTLVARFIGYSQTVVATFNVGLFRQAPNWREIATCGR